MPEPTVANGNLLANGANGTFLNGDAVNKQDGKEKDNVIVVSRYHVVFQDLDGNKTRSRSAPDLLVS